MIVRLTKSALQDRDEIFEHIAHEDPTAATRMDLRFVKATERLATFPYSARPGQIAGTRELIAHPSYRIIYQVEEQLVVIVSVVHTSRQWPPDSDT